MTIVDYQKICYFCEGDKIFPVSYISGFPESYVIICCKDCNKEYETPL